MPSADPDAREPIHPHVVILSGGIGTRFWPASTPARPKQLLPLASDRPLVADTLERARVLTRGSRIHFLAGAPMATALRAGLPILPDEAFWIEPWGRGTGPALTWAAHQVAAADPEGILVSLHADHRIGPLEAFRETVAGAVALAAATDRLFTVAISPDRPETGFGWIRPGPRLEVEGDPGAGANGDAGGGDAPVPEGGHTPAGGHRPIEGHEVAAFVEKPPLEAARRYLLEGLLWNSGIFVWKARTFLEEVKRHSPEIGPHLPLLDRGEVESFFASVSPISVDEAVLERSGRVAMVRATFEWDDVGSWESLTRARPADPQGNVAEGPLLAVEARGNVSWSDEGPVVLFGVDDLVVIRSGGVTVVAPRNRSADWKTLLHRLPPQLTDPESSA